jgi:uncharacterized protein (DUF58 family)
MNFFPERKLVIWGAIVGLPFGTILGWSDDLTLPASVILILFIVLILWDLLQIWPAFKDFSLEQVERIRLRVGREEPLLFTLKGLRGTAYWLSLRSSGALELQDALQYCRVEVGKINASFRLLALARGDAQIEELGIGAISAMGFWRRQKIVRLHIPVQMFPDLEGNQPKLAALLHQFREGHHALRFTGQGQDFDRLRLYEPGDSWTNINWKATARHRFPVSQLYRQEQSQDIVVLLDVSRHAASTVAPEAERQRSVLDHSLQTVLWLARFTEMYGDRLGLLCFDNSLRYYLKPAMGKQHYTQCREILYGLKPSERLPDYGELFTSLRYKISKRALVICLGQVPDTHTRKSIQQSLTLGLRQHLFIFAHMRGAWERPVLTGESLSHVNDIYQALAGHLCWSDHQAFAMECKKNGAEFLHSAPENFTFDILQRYLSIKAKSRL